MVTLADGGVSCRSQAKSSDVFRRCIIGTICCLKVCLPCRGIEHPLQILLDNVVLLFCEVEVRRGTDHKFLFQAIVMDLKDAKAAIRNGVDEDLLRNRSVRDNHSQEAMESYRVGHILVAFVEFH